MDQTTDKLHESPLYRLYASFSPVGRAVILLAIPFTLVDAIHYFTAGTALVFTAPILGLIYLFCGSIAARMSYKNDGNTAILAKTGSMAAIFLWVTSTIINALLMVILGFASLGFTLVSGIFYLCLSAPFQLIGSALFGWLGGWLVSQLLTRLGEK